MLNEKISKYTAAFFERFKDYLVIPQVLPIQPEDNERVVTNGLQAVLPAREKFSDWDIYCLVDNTKVNLTILKEMRDFIFSYKDFTLTRDYVTCNEAHIKAGAYQSVEGNLYWMQFMTFLNDTDNAPFADIHIFGIPTEMLEAFYSPISKTEDTGYLDWALITLWRKYRKTGEINKDDSFYVRSIYPVLSPKQKESTDKDMPDFLQSYFENRLEFKMVSNFLLS